MWKVQQVHMMMEMSEVHQMVVVGKQSHWSLSPCPSPCKGGVISYLGWCWCLIGSQTHSCPNPKQHLTYRKEGVIMKEHQKGKTWAHVGW